MSHGGQKIIALLLFGRTDLWLIKFFQSSPFSQVLNLNLELLSTAMLFNHSNFPLPVISTSFCKNRGRGKRFWFGMNGG